MITPNSFLEFLDVGLSDQIGKLERERQKALKYLAYATLCLVLAIPSLYISFLIFDPKDSGSMIFLSGGLPTLVFLIIYGVKFFKQYRFVKRNFKQDIIANIVRFIDRNLEYFPGEKIGKELFSASKIFLRTADRYHGDDLVQGTIGQTAISFSELHAQYRTQDSKGRNQYKTLFRGIFFTSDFHKHFDGETIILPDTAEKMFGWLGKTLQNWNLARPQLVNMEDPDFEREFVVYSTDQVEARYILSTALISRLLEFKLKTGKKISLSFVGNNMYMSIPYNRTLFELNLFRSLGRSDKMMEYFNDLKLLTGIVDDLNLNTRIWTRN